jgi:AGZA family xanthine/uracil permease-like MFS transporter
VPGPSSWSASCRDRLVSSISNGIGAGVITYALLKLVKGKGREVHPLLYAVAVLFVLYFLRGPLEALIL